MEDNDSLALAEAWVHENLLREVYEQGLVADGEMIDVLGLRQCDCIPVTVEMNRQGCSGRWDLRRVKEVQGDLRALYEFSQPTKQVTHASS